MVLLVTRLSIVDWVCFKTQILLLTLRTQISTSGGILCIIGSRTFVSISWMCKMQTSISHISTESGIISLYAWLRMDGLITCFRFMGCGDRSVAFDKQHLETDVRQDTVRQITDPNPNKGEPRCWAIVECGPRSHKHPFFLKASLSCTFMKTAKRPSNSSLKAEGQQRVSCKIPIKYVDTKNQLADILPMEALHVMSWTIFFVCWKSRISGCSLAAISFKQKAECHVKERDRRYFQKVRRWRSWDQWIWCRTTSWLQGRTLRKTWAIPITRGMPKRNKVVFHPASGNRCEVCRHTWRWSFTTCKSQTINTWEKSSKICTRSWRPRRFHQHVGLKQ